MRKLIVALAFLTGILAGLATILFCVVVMPPASGPSAEDQLAPDQVDEVIRRASLGYGQPFDAGDDISAYLMAKEFVKDQLKAPRTAKWPSSSSSKGVSIDSLGGGRYRVRSWVDSQNSFGAMLRMHYVAEVRTSDGKNWSLVWLVTEP